MRVIESSFDDKLLIRIANGNEDAFRQLFEEYKNKVYNYSFYFTHSVVVAEEITQDVFLRIWLSKESLATVRNIDAWLSTITRNLCLNYLKNAALRDKLQLALTHSILPSEQNVDNYIFYKDQLNLLSEAMTGLSPQQRTIFKLNQDCGLRNEEIAKQLNLSPNTVKSHLLSATRKIRRFLETHPAHIILFVFSLLGKF